MGENKKIDLDGKTWTRYSISIWDDINKTPEERKLKHPAMYPQEIVQKLLKVYTHKGDKVLDPFLGSGSTLIACNKEERNGVGFDINEEYTELILERLESIDSKTQHVIKDDAFNLKHHLKNESIDFCVTSPPYWDVLNQKRTADYKDKRPYSNSNHDLGNIVDYDAFLESMKSLFTDVYDVLKKGKRCVVIVMDIRKGSKFYPLHMDIVQKMREIGFDLDDIVIWDRRKEYNFLRPLGFPYVFRINKVHEFVLIFQKPK